MHALKLQIYVITMNLKSKMGEKLQLECYIGPFEWWLYLFMCFFLKKVQGLVSV